MVAQIETDLAASAELARRHLDDYCEFMTPGYTRGAHTRALVETLEAVEQGQIKRALIIMPPRHSKSLHVSQRFPGWFIGRKPDRRVIAASHTQQLAEDFSLDVRSDIQDERYPFSVEHAIEGVRRGPVKISDTRGLVQRWRTNHGGEYLAVGVGGSPAGKGGDLIVIDDPIKNAAVALSQKSRDTLWSWYTRDIFTRRQPGASIIICATRWHNDDLTGRILDRIESGREHWEVLHFPAIATSYDSIGRAPGDVLWPEFWPQAEYESWRDDLPPDAFSALYQGMPTSSAGSIVKRESLRYWQYEGMQLPPIEVLDDQGRVAAAHPVMTLPRHFDAELSSWDATFKKTESGSFVVGLQAGIVGQTTFLIDRYRARADFVETLNAIAEQRARYPRTRRTLIEAKANGPAIISTLQRKIAGIIGVETSEGDKVARLRAGTWYIESGNLVVPHPAIAPWSREYVDELTEFPYSAHDDQVDATSQLIMNVTDGMETGLDDVVADMMRDWGTMR